MTFRKLIQQAGCAVLVLAAMGVVSLGQAAGLLQPKDGSLPK